ncbi:MAG: hypothetical protein JXR73_23650 [Candidatus Omnitrophica bacterium]|nr:hypothetical protein [Candidatus Omnitrophota bacterium]
MNISTMTQSLNSQAAVGMLLVKVMDQAKQLIDQQAERIASQVKEDIASIDTVGEVAGGGSAEKVRSSGEIGRSLNIIA